VNYGFVIDHRKCIGCHACTVACKAEHDVPLGVNRTWVKYIEKGTFPQTRRFFSVLRCNHCADAPCVTICPVTALFTREDGIVDFDSNRCIGCKACMQACPYDALYIDPRTQTAAKCNFCAHRVEVGLEPPCAVVCPEHAIIAGDMDDPATEIAGLIRIQQVQVRKPEKGTDPKVFYIGADSASLVPGATSVRADYTWSQGREPGPEPRAPLERGQDAGGRPGAAPPERGELAPEIWDRVRAVMGEKASEARRVYDAGQTHQDSWGWKVSGYLWTKAVACGTLMVAPFLGPDSLRGSALALSLLFLAVTAALLIGDLKRPDRFLWVITRPQWRSWLTRGSYILMGTGGAAAALAAAHAAGVTAFGPAAAIAAVVLGAAGAAYTAFLFWQAKGRDLWQSPLLPLHLVVQAGVAGLAAVQLASSAGLGAAAWLPLVLAIALGIHALLVLLEMGAVHQTEDATAAARWARTGSRGHLLVWGVIGAGHAAPLALLSLRHPMAAAAASLLALTGLALYEHLYVRAGQSVALS
jgi:Fe-S-cluster-containing dehydrogenase component/formate-dependent nitrite reductase membrane component NrfD